MPNVVQYVGHSLHTFWCRTVKIGQGVSTRWAKKFAKISNFSPFRNFTSIYLRKYLKKAYKQRTEKSFISPLSNCRMCLDPSVTGFYRITPRATELSTVSVFLSVVKCGSVCRAQTCAHSGIRPFRLAKGFPQGGPKSSKKFEFLTIS